MMDFWKTVLTELQAGRRVYACFVAANRKGSPGTPAARMLLLENGEQVGTIGGGVMELQVIEAAKKKLTQAFSGAVLPQLQQLRHDKKYEDQASGLICGGAQTNVAMILSAQQIEVVARICRCLESDADGFVLMGAAGLSFSDIATEGLFNVGADDWFYALELCNRRRVAIFGGGHCGVALARQMDRLGYQVAIVEPRLGLFTMRDLPSRIRVLALDFDAGAEAVARPECTIAIVMTHSMRTDIRALSGILNCPYAFVGLMGSFSKISHIRSELLAAGLSIEKIDRIVAPVGLDFNSDTPEEISVSIAAQILLNRESAT